MEEVPSAHACALIAYDYAHRIDPELASEMFITFLPVAQRMVERYRPQPGKSFSNYLLSAIRHRWLSLRMGEFRAEYDRRDVLMVALRPEKADPPEGPARVVVPAPRSATVRRGICMAAVSCMEEIGEDRARLVEALVGMPVTPVPPSLKDDARDRLERFRRTRDRAYSAMLRYQGRLRRETDPEQRERLIDLEARSRLRMERARRMIRRMRVQPSHREIAEATGVPKGTIDSAIFAAYRAVG